MVKLYPLFKTQDPENYTQLGGTYPFRPNKEAPTPQSSVEVTPSFMNVTFMFCFSPGAAHGVDSSELVSHPLHAPVGVTHSCMNVTYELCELTSTRSPPTVGGSYPSCVNVTDGLSLSLGASSPTPSPLGELASPVWMLLTLLCLSLGAAHGVDSSELAFRLAAIGAMREGKGQHFRSHGPLSIENRRWLWFYFASGVLWSIQVVKKLKKHETLEPMVSKLRKCSSSFVSIGRV